LFNEEAGQRKGKKSFAALSFQFFPTKGYQHQPA
jgi:hypothetical protein